LATPAEEEPEPLDASAGVVAAVVDADGLAYPRHIAPPTTPKTRATTNRRASNAGLDPLDGGGWGGSPEGVGGGAHGGAGGSHAGPDSGSDPGPETGPDSGSDPSW